MHHIIITILIFEPSLCPYKPSLCPYKNIFVPSCLCYNSFVLVQAPLFITILYLVMKFADGLPLSAWLLKH